MNPSIKTSQSVGGQTHPSYVDYLRTQVQLLESLVEAQDRRERRQQKIIDALYLWIKIRGVKTPTLQQLRMIGMGINPYAKPTTKKKEAMEWIKTFMQNSSTQESSETTNSIKLSSGQAK